MFFFSEWQSFYPYHGGRFAINGDADNIYVIDNQKDNALTHSSTERDGSMVRHEQGWYFPRDGHSEQDLTRTYDSNSSDKPPPHGVGYTANYSNYNGLLHGYYDARTGTQISPSVVHYPHSGIEVSDTTDGHTSNDSAPRQHYQASYNTKERTKPTKRLLVRNESQPIYANHLMVSSYGANSNWFTPHSHNHIERHASTLSPISLSYDREQEIVLKPSLPRHSSMKPSIHVPADDEDEVPFDAQLSVIRESDGTNTAIGPVDYSFHKSEEDPYTNGWVQSQTTPFNSRTFHQQRSNTLHSNVSDHSVRARGYHTLTTNDLPRNPSSSQQPAAMRQIRERGSSISSSVNEMRTHYNRDRLLGTVERVRSTSSRSRRPGSFASVSSGQLSPQPPHGYVHSPLPPPYQLTECYPELVSPVYYNNNNNRQSESVQTQRSFTSRNRSHEPPSPRYENSGLLTSTKYHGPSFSGYESSEPSRLMTSSNITSGLGSAWSQSHLDGNHRRSRPSWSRSSAQTPYEYDISCESSPAAVLPRLSNGKSRHFGLYAKPKYTNHTSHTTSSGWNTRHHQTSYDPSFLSDNYSTHLYHTNQLTPPSHKLPMQAPSDSVDENYEFDPILIDSEPQDFFHVQTESIIEEAAEPTSSHTPYRPSLYAEQRTPPVSSNTQRFNRLRNEFNTYREWQKHASNRMALSHLESDIL